MAGFKLPIWHCWTQRGNDVHSWLSEIGKNQIQHTTERINESMNQWINEVCWTLGIKEKPSASLRSLFRPARIWPCNRSNFSSNAGYKGPRSHTFDLFRKRVSFGSFTFNTKPCPGISWGPHSDYGEVSEPEAMRAKVSVRRLLPTRKWNLDQKYPKQGVYAIPYRKSRGRVIPGLLNSMTQQCLPLSVSGVSVAVAVPDSTGSWQ